VIGYLTTIKNFKGRVINMPPFGDSKGEKAGVDDKEIMLFMAWDRHEEALTMLRKQEVTRIMDDDGGGRLGECLLKLKCTAELRNYQKKYKKLRGDDFFSL
jgi:hypothetical protein